MRYSLRDFTAWTHARGESYLDYITKIRDSGNVIARDIKLVDIMHNSSRLDGLTPDTKNRLTEKYRNAASTLAR